MQPQIISSYNEGIHNANLEATVSRLDKEAAYKDLSTIIIVPAFGAIPTRVVASWLSMYAPPNQKLVRLFAVGMEVGEAYSSCIDSILQHPEMSKFRYILTLEHDNITPPDGLVRLLQRAEQNPHMDVISALYFTKGYGGQPQTWGDVRDPILNYRPQKPDLNGGLIEVCGTGMGMTLFKLAMFKDSRLRRPWFKTTNGTSGEGLQTQDLYFAGDARKHGYRFGVDCAVRSGHYDLEGKYGPPDTVW